MQSTKAGAQAAIIGVAKEKIPGRVEMKTVLGGARIVDRLVGEQLPKDLLNAKCTFFRFIDGHDTRA